MEISAFLERELLNQYGQRTAERILEGYRTRRPVTLRVNRLMTQPQAVRDALEGAQIGASPVPWYADGLILSGAREEDVSALPVYAQGGIYLQSLSSMLPPLVLDAQPGENVLDMAAAPGGKTTQIASMTGNAAMITACERNAARADRLRFNVARQGAARVTVMNMDARQLDDLFRFDRVLLDAPCSGSGTVGPDTKGRFTPEYLARTTKLQSTLLDKALRLLRPGCEMVYSTCSVLAQENEDVVRRALASGQAELVPVDAAAFDGVPLLKSRIPGTLLVCPDALYEGFFVAKLRKRAGKKG